MEAALAPPVSRLTFKLGSSILALDVSDAAVRDMVEATFGRMRCEGVRANRQFTACIRPLADGRLHARFGGRALPLPAAAGTVAMRDAYYAAREIFARFAASHPGSVALYGAALAVQGAGALIVGPATIGKTILALHAAHRGAVFLGDETALLSLRGGELWAMPRKPALRESGLNLLPREIMRERISASTRAFESERGRFWYALDANHLDGIEPAERGFPLRAVFVIASRGDAVRVRELDASAALPLVSQRAYVRPSELAQIAALKKALRRASCFELTLGEPEQTAAVLMERAAACA